MSNYKLSKEDEEYLRNYRNKDGSPLSEAQIEAKLDIIARFLLTIFDNQLHGTRQGDGRRLKRSSHLTLCFVFYPNKTKKHSFLS